MDLAREIDKLLVGVMAPFGEITETPILNFEEPMLEDVIFSGGDAILSSSNVASLGSPTLPYDTDKLGEDIQSSVEVLPVNLNSVVLNWDFSTNLSNAIVFEDFNQYLEPLMSEPELNTILEPLSPVLQPLSTMSEPLSIESEPLSIESEPLSILSEPYSIVSEPSIPVSEPLNMMSEPPSTVSEPLNATDGSGIIIQPTQQSLSDPLLNLVNHLDIKSQSPAPTQVKPKKRGRKPKSETGLTRRELRRQKKVKVYEMPPLENEEAEKKRKNALNAKRHRDLAKQKMAKVEQSLEDLKKERDQLLQEVERLRQNEQNLRQLLNQRQCAFVTP